MPEEESRIDATCTDDHPPDIGFTIVAEAILGSSEELLTKVRSVWVVVAKWGRVWDQYDEPELAGDYIELPLQEELNQLPDWMQTVWRSLSDGAFESWRNDLEDREWIWWCSTTIGRYVIVDLNLESYPIGHWAIRTVIEKAGGTIVYCDGWVPPAKVPQIVTLWEKQRERIFYEDILTAEEAQHILLRLGSRRFGDPEAVTRQTIESITSVERLEQLIDRISDVEGWTDLLA